MLREINYRANSSSPGPLEAAEPTRPSPHRTDTDGSAWRPTLDQVLANTAPPPYTLSAFMAYLSQNHCLENLEFILDAKRYRESYNSLVDRLGESGVTTDAAGSQRLRVLWQLLLTAYILPGAQREVNLSVGVRDALLRHKDVSTPPLPEALDPAVKSIHDLMEDSIFFAFLNSHSTPSRTDPASVTSNGRNIADQRPKLLRSRSKRPSLSPVGRTWSWPPWTRQAD